MAANAALYLPTNSVDLTRVFPAARAHASTAGSISHFEIELGGDAVRLNVMLEDRLASHLRGLLSYVDSLDQDATRKRDASFVLSHTKMVLGLETEREFDENNAIWQALFRIAAAYDGYVFAFDSVLLPSGAVLVGPLLDQV